MAKTLQKKLRKFFRRTQREDFLLGINGNERELFNKLPLYVYETLELDLTDDEFYRLNRIFDTHGRGRMLFDLIPKGNYLWRCCRNLNLVDDLSDEKLECILNNVRNGISNLLFAQGQSFNRQHRIINLLHEDILEKEISLLTGSNFSELNDFLVWLYEKERDEEFVSESEKATVVFQKLANLSDRAIAILLENTDTCVVKRILQELCNAERDIFPIYQGIQRYKLYEVIVKSDYELLNNANDIVYSWIYSNLDEEEEDNFSRYLADEKRFELQLFNGEICSGIYKVLPEGDEVEFIKEIFKQKGIAGFESFYEILSTDEKGRMFGLLLEDKGGRELVGNFLNAKKEEEMNFFERIIKEHYF